MKVNIVINMAETTSFVYLGNFSLMVEIEVAIRHHSLFCMIKSSED